MRELHDLDKSLLNSEFELGKALYERMRAQGYPPFKSAAMIYRHGVLDGKDEARHWKKEYHKLKHSLRLNDECIVSETRPPEATTEGSTENV